MNNIFTVRAFLQYFFLQVLNEVQNLPAIQQLHSSVSDPTMGSSSMMLEMPYYGTQPDFHNGDAPEPSKKKRALHYSLPAQARRMQTRALLIDGMKAPTTFEEKLEHEAKLITDQFDNSAAQSIDKHLPLGARQTLFKILLTFLSIFGGLSEVHVKNFTVHEFLSAYTQMQKGVDPIILQIERQTGNFFHVFTSQFCI